MLKRKVKPDAMMTIAVTPEIKQFLQDTSKRSRLSVGDLIVMSWGNGFDRNTIYPKYCTTCKRENWRDEEGIVYMLYDVEVDSCMYCGAEGDDF